jgi:hypothetical protein
MDSQIKHRIIDKILSISDEKLLSEIDHLLDSKGSVSSYVSLTEEQKQMLEWSEEDIANGDTISQSELDQEDLAWLRGK